MRFTHAPEVVEFAAAVRDYLAAGCTPNHVRTAWQAGTYDGERWKQLAALGVTGTTIAEEHGGLGLDLPALGLLLEEAGRAALPEPVIETVVVAAPLLAELGGDLAVEWLPRIVAGDATVVVALEADPYPAHVASAGLVLLQQADEVIAAPPSALDVAAQPNVDAARPTSRVQIPATGGADQHAQSEGPGHPASRVQIPGTGGAEQHTLLERAAQRGAWGAAAMLVGAGARMIELARDHALTREQFGQPIGSFQAVKHMLASALVEIEFARPLVERAGFALQTRDPDAALYVSAAKAFASEAAEQAARAAIQVHGAIGYTWESDLHLWMKRTWSLSAAWGDVETHWQTVETALMAG